MCISESLFYSKQDSDSKRPTPYVASTDYIHNELERPKQLSNFDLCLQHTDCAWHSPLVVRISSHSTRNQRTRSAASSTKRSERYQEKKGKGKSNESSSSRHHGKGSYYQDDDRHSGPYQSQHRRQREGWYGYSSIDILLRFCNLSNIPVC